MRAYARSARRPARAGLVLVEVGVRHVERDSRLRPPYQLAALHALCYLPKQCLGTLAAATTRRIIIHEAA